MKGNILLKKGAFLFFILTFCSMLVSCQAIFSAIGSLISFLFFAAIMLAGIIGGIFLLYFDSEKSRPLFVFFGIVCFWVSVFSLSKIIGFVTRPLLIIAIISQIIVLIIKRDYLSDNLGSLWLVIASSLCSLIYIFGFLKTYIVPLPVYSLNLTISPSILIILSCIIPAIPIVIIDSINKATDILLSLFILLGLTFASIMGAGFWWIVLGLGVPLIISAIISSIDDNRKRKEEEIRKAEERKQKKAEAERKRLEQEEYERNRPIEEKLAELEKLALEFPRFCGQFIKPLFLLML